MHRLTGWIGGYGGITSTVLDIPGAVNYSRANRESLPAVVRAIALVSGDVARVPLRSIDNTGRDAYAASMSLVTSSANAHQSGGAWRAWMVSSAIRSGVAYSYIQRDSRGDPVALMPLAPGRIQVEWSGLEPAYTLDGSKIDSYSLLSLLAGAGDATNPYTCRSPLEQCAPTLALAIAQESVASALAQAGRVGKISITHPGTLSTTAKLDLLDSYTRKHISPSGAARPLVLDEGVKVERVGDGSLPGLLEDRRYCVVEIGRALGVPPQMLFQGDAGALSSQVEMQRQYVDGTISHWCDRLTTSLTAQLMPPGVRVVADLTPLQRGNLKDTATAIKHASAAGVLTANDARAMLGLSPVDGGDVLLQSRDITPDVEVDGA